jgi:hypothetical protein
MAPRKKTKKDSHAIPAYAGFAAQPTRMALLLLEANPGSNVSLELLDDVAVETAEGTILASQMKSGTKKNPVSDRSVELWKTFANWVRQVRSGELDPTRTIFELYVRKASSNSLVRQLGEAKTKEAAGIAFESVRQCLWGEEPQFQKRPSVAEGLQPHLDEIFGSKAGARSFRAIIERFQLTVGLNSPTQALHEHIANHTFVEAAAVEKVVCFFQGWVKTQTDSQIDATGRPPVIARDLAWKELRAFYRSIASGGNLPDIAEKPTNEDYTQLSGLRFVRQLELIKLQTPSLRYAMTSYFRAASARTRWVDNDLVRKESLVDLEDGLAQAHRDYREKIYTQSADTDELKGRILLGECNKHHCQLEGKATPEYFIPGCFHSLSDRMLLGWHPRFEELLRNVA